MDSSREPLLPSRHGHRRYTENKCTSIQGNVESEYNVDNIAVGCVLVTALCERLAYYSVNINIIPFCTSKTLNMTSTDATTVSLSFSGFVFIIPLFAGWIADTLAGKYKTILWSGLIFILGLLMLLASDVDYVTWFKTRPVNVNIRIGLFVVALVLVAFGSGGIRSNTGPLGAQKVEGSGPQAVQTFFSWFYWFLNNGAFIASSGVAYVQLKLGFTWAFLIPLLVMIFSQIVFKVCKSRLSSTPVEGSPICDVIRVCLAGALTYRSNQTEIQYRKETVDRVRSFTKLLPVCGVFIVYWTVYAQSTSTFLLQSERLDISVGFKQVPVAILFSFNSVAIILLVPMMQLFVYPYLIRLNHELSLLQRIAIGMVLAIFSVLAAGVVEFFRKEHMTLNQTIEHNHYNASTISVFAQIPQFALFGASEVFASIAGMEFAYSQAPNMMKRLCMGMFLETTGIGSFCSLIIIAIVKKIKLTASWFPDEINYGKIEYLFFLMAILMFFNFCLFLVVAYCYKYKPATEETVVKHETLQRAKTSRRNFKLRAVLCKSVISMIRDYHISIQ